MWSQSQNNNNTAVTYKYINVLCYTLHTFTYSYCIPKKSNKNNEITPTNRVVVKLYTQVRSIRCDGYIHNAE